MAQAFPLNWPPALQSLFEFQSIVSTIGESLVNPDCVAESRGAALFYQKQAGFATTPFLATAVAFAFWFVRGYVKGTPFFAKRASIARLSGEPVEEVSTPKDKFVVTVCVVLYMIYPTLCKRAFEMFNCKTIAGVQYLRADLEARVLRGRPPCGRADLGIRAATNICDWGTGPRARVPPPEPAAPRGRVESPRRDGSLRPLLQ